MEEENEDYLLTALPPSFYYIPNFVSEAEEANLMRHIEQSPGPRWDIFNLWRNTMQYNQELYLSNNWDDKTLDDIILIFLRKMDTAGKSEAAELGWCSSP